MAVSGFKGVLGVCVAGSLMLGSTAASAAPAAPAQTVDPWAVLTAMSGGAPAAAICGSAAVAAAAAQPAGGCVLPVVDTPPPPPAAAAEGPPPPPPFVAAAGGGGISPLLIGLVAIVAGVGVFLAVHNNGHHPNSPA